MNELKLIEKPTNILLRISLMVLGMIVSVCSATLLFRRYYLFFFEHRTYRNRKILYKWLKDGNRPTKCKYFEFWPRWESNGYVIRLFPKGRLESRLACYNSSKEIVFGSYTNHPNDKKIVSEITDMLLDQTC